MIFQLGNKKNDSNRPVEAETIQRWREIATGKKTESSLAAEATPPTTVETATAPLWFDAITPSKKTETPQIKATATAVPVGPKKEYGEVRSALGPGTVIEGKLTFDSPVRIDGTLKGEVTSSSLLIVGEQAVVDAKVNVGSLIVHGHVAGKVDAAEFVEIKNGGSLQASINTGRLIIEEGGYFTGGCNNR